MMKTVMLLLCILTIGACNKKKDSSSTVTPPAAHKDTLSAWLVLPSNAWGPRLDDVTANLAGTPFTMAFKFSDTTEVQCSNTILAGSEATGSWDNSGCVATGGMATATGTAPFITNVAGGTYTNDGTTLTLCSNGTNSCLTYE